MPTRYSAPTLLMLLLPATLVLTACDLLGDEAKASAKEAEGRAIGSGCRHTGRSLEDCYKLNAKASKAAIFAGWRDMDGYMRENKIEIIPPSAEPAHPAGEASTEEGAQKAADASANPAKPAAEASPSAESKPAAKAETGKGKTTAAPVPPNAASANSAPSSPKPAQKPSH